MSVPHTYLNGRILPATDATLSLADAGFVSGATIVDNARTYGGTLFRWAEHLSRFRRDCERCFVPLLASDDELTRLAGELLAHNRPLAGMQDLHVVTVATPGPPGGPPTLAMSMYPIRVERYRPFFTDGVTLAVAGSQTSDGNDLLPPSVKHRSRLHWHIAERAVAAKHPGAVPVVLNRGVGDTAIGAIAAVHADGTLLLPPPELVQDSISLKVLTEMAGRSRVERFSWWSDDVVELLLTGTGFGVASVKTVHHGDTRTFDWPGPMYRRLAKAWSELVGVDYEKQFTEVP
ncbi:MAG: aminotransferase class IV [Planctomycetia bacterium]|nr:aminotransferase class IV [Planctomycetia bacterium]